MEFTISFARVFFTLVYYIAPILLSLVSVILVLGVIAGRNEGWSVFDSLYWAFITAFTVGYGDFRPAHKSSKVLAVIIAWLGIMFTGVIVAGTVAATTSAIKMSISPAVLEEARRKFDQPASSGKSH